MQKPDFRQNPQIQENSSTEIPALHFYYKNVIRKNLLVQEGFKNLLTVKPSFQEKKKKNEKETVKGESLF